MNFTLLAEQKNTFAHSTLYHYKHTHTHCEVLHVHNDDKENVCMFCVPTYPQDSSGVAHILEHTVLSGSRKFRVKEPFYKILKSSCKTFLNAMTYSDRTLYPVASTIEEDLFNLIDVYADALLFPLLDESQFRQEGFYFLNAKNSQKLEAAGVVYNEMKGVYSDRDSLVIEGIQKLLFPHNIYRFDSGGNPNDIPTLEYKQFKDFHARWYRPEFIKIIVYGNIPSQHYLDFLHDKYLSQWQEKPHEAYTPIAMHDPIDSRAIHAISVPSTDNEGLYSIDITWALPINSISPLERLSISLLHTVLVGIPGAALRARLLSSKKAEDLSNLTGLETDLHQLVYTIGLTGIKKSDIQDAQSIEKLILDTLEQVLDEDIDPQLIEATLHRIEFGMKESLVSTGKKIGWLCSIAKTWLYEGDFFASSDPVLAVQELTKKLEDPQYLNKIGKEYLLNNTHRCTLVAEPTLEHDAQVSHKEDSMIHSMYEQQKANNDLAYWQDIEKQISLNNKTEDDPKKLEALPSLQVEDLPKKIELWKQSRTSLDSNVMQFLDLEDNGIFYIWHQFDITDIIKDDKHARFIVSTLTACFTDLGTTNNAYHILASKIRSIAGRLSATVDHVADMQGNIRIYFSVKLNVLQRNLLKAIDLLIELFTSIEYGNTERLSEIINEGKNSIRSRIVTHATNLAIVKAASLCSESARIDDDQNGMTQLQHLLDFSTLSNSYGKDLQVLAQKIFTKERLEFMVATSSVYRGEIEKALQKVLTVLPQSYTTTHDTNTYKTPQYAVLDTNIKAQKRAYIIASQVAFNALVFPIIKYNDPHYAAFDMMARVISSKLWDTIRLQYGAYGAGCSVIGSEGLIEFYTYRDPNIVRSYETFYTSLQEVSVGNFSDNEINMLVIGMIGETLHPISPAGKAVSAYRRHWGGITDELRQSIRDSIFRLQKKDVVNAALYCLEKWNTASFATLCNEKTILEQNSKNWQWDSIEKLPQ